MDNRLLNEIQHSRKLMGLSEGLNLPKASKYRNWIGMDRDLVVSLDEYHWVARQPQKRDYSDEWFIIFKVSDNAFDHGWIRESYLDNIMLGNEWANKDDIKRVLGYTDKISVEEWLVDDFSLKFQDLTSYFGFENIMGSSYHTVTLKDAIILINEYSGQPPVDPDDYI